MSDSNAITVIEEKKLLMALGMGARARKLIFGVPMICDSLRHGGQSMPRLVFAASDISENTKKRIMDRCAFYHVRLVMLPCGGEALAEAVGKSAPLAAVAVSDDGICRLTEQYVRFG
ncbi:MAG: hypothetical protein E7664_02595 [Ruminococcaceae bacterium]|nr:hypothetical protein [Oscillospiraceae bacterium]